MWPAVCSLLQLAHRCTHVGSDRRAHRRRECSDALSVDWRRNAHRRDPAHDVADARASGDALSGGGRRWHARELVEEGARRVYCCATQRHVHARIGGVHLCDVPRLLVRGAAEHEDNDLRRRFALCRHLRLGAHVRVVGLGEGRLERRLKRAAEERRVLRVDVLHALHAALKLLLCHREPRLIREKVARSLRTAVVRQHALHLLRALHRQHLAKLLDAVAGEALVAERVEQHQPQLVGVGDVVLAEKRLHLGDGRRVIFGARELLLDLRHLHQPAGVD
mmetsp:Transcript_6230/g.14379  ORF Transcript_6230/g.14379 Transcript_6230/m.14379 type:complete len:278 (-) Transcript_6230:432-1265(-)